MTDRDKIIQGLKCCYGSDNARCFECPYHGMRDCEYFLRNDSCRTLLEENTKDETHEVGSDLR